jgi:UDP-GlcNAc3NAcA epimerase
MKILSVVGNRPQFIKSGPLSVALRTAGIDELVVHTGQHWDRELSQVFFEELGLGEPTYRLESHTRDVDAMQPGIVSAIAAERPDVVVVFGDTNSTVAGARAAREAGVPLAHVEAGMRSGDMAMPEEHNRIEVDLLADLLLCPDERSAEILRGEGVSGRAEVVGDVMADANRVFAPIARARSTILDRVGLEPGQYLVATIHRDANVEPARLHRIIGELNAMGRSIVFPAHPRTRATMEAHDIRAAPYVRVLDPLGYLDMLALVAQAQVLVTDSGGLQKEAYWLGVPCVTLRPSTEWVDTVLVGANTLVDPANVEQLGAAISNAQMPTNAPPLYGDGHAADRIAEALGTLSSR